MDNSLNEIFIIIDNLNADENIKQFYKGALKLEIQKNLHYKSEYEKLINKFVEDDL
ncbi:MAG: hypothetical protein IJ287_07775 [Methanobrevibacter sp.]|nr:hypothetical protein [Methanobrevibacter sp.]